MGSNKSTTVSYCILYTKTWLKTVDSEKYVGESVALKSEDKTETDSCEWSGERGRRRRAENTRRPFGDKSMRNKAGGNASVSKLALILAEWARTRE